MDTLPDLERLTHIFSQAAAPAFFLGAVAGFISLMSSRMVNVVGRIKDVNAIRAEEEARLHLKADVGRLVHRAELLNNGIFLALCGGICATLLLFDLFASDFFGLQYAYGAGLLFMMATILLGCALFRFAQEARIGLVEFDHYQ